MYKCEVVKFRCDIEWAKSRHFKGTTLNEYGTRVIYGSVNKDVIILSKLWYGQWATVHLASHGHQIVPR